MITFDYLRVNRILAEKINKELSSFSLLKSEKEIYNYNKTTEKSFADYVGMQNAFFLDSGTTALQLVLQLLNIGENDEVILPVSCYPSIILSILYRKAIPVFVDIKEDCTIDENLIEEKITSKTKAIVPVHLFGHACNMGRIMEIANKHNLKVIEDACQSHSSTLNGRMLGSFGHVNFFSFTYHKTISAFGGGAIVSNENLDNVKAFVSVEKDDNFLLTSGRAPGKMSNGDTVILRTKLRYRKYIEESKLKIKQYYEDGLSNVSQCKLIIDSENVTSIRQTYVAYFEKRNELLDYLQSKGIDSKLPYKSAYLLDNFKEFCHGEYPNARLYDEKILYLPMYPFMKQSEVEYICNTIKEFYSQ